MTLHQVLPLIAFLLNLALMAIALVRNPRSRLNRLFAYLLAGFASWNIGVFMLRRAPRADEGGAIFAEVVVHAGLTMVPAFFYHFVLIFLDSTVLRRRSLIVAYALSAVFFVLNLSGSPLFMKGVKWTSWGWAPAPGVLYNVFILLVLYPVLMYALVLLGKECRRSRSGFRRNRALLFLFGISLTLAAGVVDVIRFALSKTFPVLDLLYPPGIPANMICAVLIGISIVRYRMFDVSAAVKKAALYFILWGAITSFLFLVEGYFAWQDMTSVWIVGPLGFLITVLLSPLARPLEDRIERVMFTKRRGCYDTLLTLSKQMSILLNFRTLVDTVVDGLVRGVPLTHCVLLIEDRATGSFVPRRAATATGETVEAQALVPDSAVVQWLTRSDGVLVKEEVKLNPRMAEYFEASESELEAIRASVIVPLKVERKLIGILLLGEKLSGEIFDSQELEMLALLANQAAIAMENARLYEDLATKNTQLMQANTLKSQFLANMSHELRTPLNSIIGFSRVLLKRLEGDLNERQETQIRLVHNSSLHLLQLINAVLDISRIEAGKVDIQRTEIDLQELIDECLETAAPLTRGKRITVGKDVPPDVPRVLADQTKLRQIVLNLLSNAIKFTTSGQVTIRVAPGPDALHVSVSDTGIGIKESDLPRLFEPFQRLESKLSVEAGGTGLGLAISKKFVESHGGRIWVESREHHGSTFHFTLPLTAATPPVIARVAS